MGTPTSVQKNVSQDTRHCNQSLFTVSPVNFIFYHCRCRYGKTRQIRGLFVFNCVAMVCIVLVLSELHSVRPADCQKLLFKVSVVGFHIGLEFHIDSEIFQTSSDFTSIRNFSNEFGFHIDSEFFKRVRISHRFRIFPNAFGFQTSSDFIKTTFYNFERIYVIGILQAPTTMEFDSVHAAAVDCKVAATPPAM